MSWVGPAGSQGHWSGCFPHPATYRRQQFGDPVLVLPGPIRPPAGAPSQRQLRSHHSLIGGGSRGLDKQFQVKAATSSLLACPPPPSTAQLLLQPQLTGRPSPKGPALGPLFTWFTCSFMCVCVCRCVSFTMFKSSVSESAPTSLTAFVTIWSHHLISHSPAAPGLSDSLSVSPQSPARGLV